MVGLAITSLTLVSAVGRGLAATEAALRTGRSGLSLCDFDGISLNTYIGRAPLEDASVVPELAVYDCRNNRLAQLALRTDGFESEVQRALTKYGPSRIGIVIGTTSSGIQEAEHVYTERPAPGANPRRGFQFEYSQSHFSVTDFVRRYL